MLIWKRTRRHSGHGGLPHIDEDVPVRLARVLSFSGHTAVTYQELGLSGAPDFEHLIIAADSSRVLLTCNFKDVRLLHGAWQRWAAAWGVTQQHSGILVLQQGMLAEEMAAAVIECQPPGVAPAGPPLSLASPNWLGAASAGDQRGGILAAFLKPGTLVLR